jgi:hypothetical protein
MEGRSRYLRNIEHLVRELEEFDFDAVPLCEVPLLIESLAEIRQLALAGKALVEWQILEH